MQEAVTPATEHQLPAEEAEPPAAADPMPDTATQVSEDATSNNDSVPVSAELPGADPVPAEDQSIEGSPKNAAAKKAEAEAAEQARHDAALQELVDSKQYALPINTVERRQTKRFVLLGIGLSVLLILIWLDIALDAGIFKLGGLKPVTHFFSN
jgi:hypothetical protein